MIIYRDGNAIKLTWKEIEQAYRIQEKYYLKCDIAEKVREIIENSGKKEKFAPDWPERVADECAVVVQKGLDNNDSYHESYNISIAYSVEDFLKNLGYNPETMEREAQA